MPKIEKLASVMAFFENQIERGNEASNAGVAVGYTAPYALYVHENLEMKLQGQPRKSGIGVYWGPHGQSKFLEQPAREMNNDGTMAKIIETALKAKKTMTQALMLAGLRLQRESQKLVPVEYGVLKASAFTRIESK